MITTKAYLIREINKLKKKRRNLKKELVTLNQTVQVKVMFKNASTILKKELLIIDSTIEAYLWVANTNQKTLPKIKKKKKIKKEIKDSTHKTEENEKRG